MTTAVADRSVVRVANGQIQAGGRVPTFPRYLSLQLTLLREGHGKVARYDERLFALLGELVQESVARYESPAAGQDRRLVALALRIAEVAHERDVLLARLWEVALVCLAAVETHDRAICGRSGPLCRAYHGDDPSAAELQRRAQAQLAGQANAERAA